ncbi:MAG: response regulator [Phormidesmis sp.]
MPSSEPSRVLVLENDYSNRILFAEYLEHCGYSVCPLADERRIFEYLESFCPDVVVLDLRMPVIDGFTIIGQLRSHPRWRKVSILVVSGCTLLSEQRKAYQLGADAYLIKPFFPSDLSLAVAQLIG